MLPLPPSNPHKPDRPDDRLRVLRSEQHARLQQSLTSWPPLLRAAAPYNDLFDDLATQMRWFSGISNFATQRMRRQGGGCKPAWFGAVLLANEFFLPRF